MFDFLSKRFSSVFARITGQAKLTEVNLEEIYTKMHDTLLEADVPYEVVDTFMRQLRQEVIGKKVIASLKPGEQFVKLVYDKLVVFLGQQQEETCTFQIPATIMVLGLQGSGKTTTLGKLAYYIQERAAKHGKKRTILCASVDFYRPAAIDQLEIVAQKVGVAFYRSSKTNVIDAAHDILNYYRQNNFELLLLDTAGRLHIDTNLMQELQALDRLVRPKYKLLVLDSMTGQESLNVARAFEHNIGFSGAILTKADSDTRSGAAFAFKYLIKKPILFLGTGEHIPDLEIFHAERMASRIIGMGDIMSLVEQAQQKIKQADHDALYTSFSQGKITLEDFARQLDMVKQVGSLSHLTKYLPGMTQVTPELLEKGEKEMKKFKAIISSMTRKERVSPRILDSSRKHRIARGAGVTVADINILLDRFEQSQQFVKLFKKFGRFNNFFN